MVINNLLFNYYFNQWLVQILSFEFISELCLHSLKDFIAFCFINKFNGSIILEIHNSIYYDFYIKNKSWNLRGRWVINVGTIRSRDVRDQKNYTLPGPGPKEKLNRDQNRNRKKITGTTTGTGTNAWIRVYMMVLTLSIFVRQKSLYSKKKSRKVLVVD